MKLKIAFRADGSNIIGMGHIYNSLAVIEALQSLSDFSVETCFITKKYPESVAKAKEAGCIVKELDAHLTEEESFKETIKILKEKEISFLVTDLLEIHDDYSPKFKKNGIKCLSLDILGKIKLKSDVIINRTTISKRFQHYNKNEETKYYLGPEYIPLRKQFLGLDKLPRQINQKVHNIMLCFGGGDEYNLSARVAWILGNFPGIKTTIVLGAAFKMEEELLEIVNQLPDKPAIIKDTRNMKDLFLQNDVAICAGGSILYELAITGTPALIVPMNDHQVENAEEFERFGSVVSLGLHTEVEDSDIHNAIKNMLDPQLRKNLSLAGKKITDGKGAERIAEIIYKFINNNLQGERDD